MVAIPTTNLLSADRRGAVLTRPMRGIDAQRAATRHLLPRIAVVPDARRVC